jgi:hypothetical protein
VCHDIDHELLARDERENSILASAVHYSDCAHALFENARVHYFRSKLHNNKAQNNNYSIVIAAAWLNKSIAAGTFHFHSAT